MLSECGGSSPERLARTSRRASTRAGGRARRRRPRAPRARRAAGQRRDGAGLDEVPAHALVGGRVRPLLHERHAVPVPAQVDRGRAPRERCADDDRVEVRHARPRSSVCTVHDVPYASRMSRAQGRDPADVDLLRRARDARLAGAQHAVPAQARARRVGAGLLPGARTRASTPSRRGCAAAGLPAASRWSAAAGGGARSRSHGARARRAGRHGWPEPETRFGEFRFPGMLKIFFGADPVGVRRRRRRDHHAALAAGFAAVRVGGGARRGGAHRAGGGRCSRRASRCTAGGRRAGGELGASSLLRMRRACAPA